MASFTPVYIRNQLSEYDSFVRTALKDGDLERMVSKEGQIKQFYKSCMRLTDPAQVAAFNGTYFLNGFLSALKKKKDSPTFIEDQMKQLRKYDAKYRFSDKFRTSTDLEQSSPVLRNCDDTAADELRFPSPSKVVSAAILKRRKAAAGYLDAADMVVSTDAAASKPSAASVIRNATPGPGPKTLTIAAAAHDHEYVKLKDIEDNKSDATASSEILKLAREKERKEKEKAREKARREKEKEDKEEKAREKARREKEKEEKEEKMKEKERAKEEKEKKEKEKTEKEKKEKEKKEREKKRKDEEKARAKEMEKKRKEEEKARAKETEKMRKEEEEKERKEKEREKKERERKRKEEEKALAKVIEKKRKEEEKKVKLQEESKERPTKKRKISKSSSSVDKPRPRLSLKIKGKGKALGGGRDDKHVDDSKSKPESSSDDESSAGSASAYKPRHLASDIEGSKERKRKRQDSVSQSGSDAPLSSQFISRNDKGKKKADDHTVIHSRPPPPPPPPSTVKGRPAPVPTGKYHDPPCLKCISTLKECEMQAAGGACVNCRAFKHKCEFSKTRKQKKSKEVVESEDDEEPTTAARYPRPAAIAALKAIQDAAASPGPSKETKPRVTKPRQKRTVKVEDSAQSEDLAKIWERLEQMSEAYAKENHTIHLKLDKLYNLFDHLKNDGRASFRILMRIYDSIIIDNKYEDSEEIEKDGQSEAEEEAEEVEVVEEDEEIDEEVEVVEKDEEIEEEVEVVEKDEDIEEEVEVVEKDEEIDEEDKLEEKNVEKIEEEEVEVVEVVPRNNVQDMGEVEKVEVLEVKQGMTKEDEKIPSAPPNVNLIQPTPDNSQKDEPPITQLHPTPPSLLPVPPITSAADTLVTNAASISLVSSAASTTPLRSSLETSPQAPGTPPDTSDNRSLQSAGTSSNVFPAAASTSSLSPLSPDPLPVVEPALSPDSISQGKLPEVAQVNIPSSHLVAAATASSSHLIAAATASSSLLVAAATASSPSPPSHLSPTVPGTSPGPSPGPASRTRSRSRSPIPPGDGTLAVPGPSPPRTRTGPRARSPSPIPGKKRKASSDIDDGVATKKTKDI